MIPDSLPTPGQASPSGTTMDQVPSIASVWRRIGGFVVDSILLGILGQIIGLSLFGFSLAFQLGPYARFIGWACILLYFGILNSAVGKGQTLGKRLLKTAVRGQDGNPISVPRSFARAFVLSLPLILNGWGLPILQSSRLVNAFVAFLLFGLGSALIYTMIFNRRARQGIHDLLCKTWVVKLASAPISKFPQTARIHFIISGILIGSSLLVASALIFLQPANLFGTDVGQLMDLQRTLLQDDRFFTVSVLDQRVYTPGSQFRILNVEVWYKGLPSRDQQIELINSVAKTTLDNFPGIDQFDRLRISILSRYDLGFSEVHVSYGDIEPIQVWRER